MKKLILLTLLMLVLSGCGNEYLLRQSGDETCLAKGTESSGEYISCIDNSELNQWNMLKDYLEVEEVNVVDEICSEAFTECKKSIGKSDCPGCMVVKDCFWTCNKTILKKTN